MSSLRTFDLLEKWQSHYIANTEQEKSVLEVSTAQKKFQHKVVGLAEHSGVHSLKSSPKILNRDSAMTNYANSFSGEYCDVQFEITVLISEKSGKLDISAVDIHSTDSIVLTSLSQTAERLKPEDLLLNFFQLFTSIVDQMTIRDNLFKCLIERIGENLQVDEEKNLVIIPSSKSPIFVLHWNIAINEDFDVYSNAVVNIDSQGCELSKDEKEFLATVPSNFSKICSLLGTSQAAVSLVRVLCSQKLE
ncbi:hypothetical protein CAPTEDRAFT_212318 [Capitella teleta]|uniref:Uncharacterized protein n=1 Tax=Capitella teleta TaxID=283909 RepID=R7T7D6_CAPTE|nr:hypothetical protein CAPTEDRAFT_212318 [Capitella teleta]|eukprot:ELT89559.1 hypothetical protein CAPTEDRAFT_212318 [Capitella teleta]